MLKLTRIFAAVFALCAVIVGDAGAAAFFPLEITNIKPAATGSPAIPATNRIFRAYPGIEYNIRAAVIGGVYPYTYSLSNAPSGMTINSRTGEIVWLNPQTDSGTIMLSVTDSESTTTSTSWDITVSTSGFRFIDASYSGVETGSIDQPYSSLANFLTATYGGALSDIVYFKSGTYPMADHNSSYDHVMNIERNPSTWLAYPDANVILQGGSATAQDAHRIYTMHSFYFDGLEFVDVVNFGISTGNGALYKTVRRCKFDGLVPADNVNNNYGFIFSSAYSMTKGYGSVVQDSEFTDWTGSAAIGSLYNEDKMLIENNSIHTPRASSTYYGIGTTIGIGAKHENDYMTIRGNSIIMDKGWLLAGLNGAYAESDYTEICFNLLVNTGSGASIAANFFDHSIDRQGVAKIWRNTNLSRIALRGTTSGPFTITGNIIVNDGEKMQENMVVQDYLNYVASAPLPGTYTSNLTGSNAATLVDFANNYKLAPGQSSHVGSRGWQFADGTTPIEGIQPAPPPGQARRLSLGGRPIKLVEPGP